MSAVTVNAVLGTYPHTKALKDGTLTDPDVTFAFTEVEPIHHAFTPMVRELAYDLSELAVVTYLQAAGFHKPLMLLPAVMASRLQRGCIVYYKPNGVVTPSDLRTARIGVRAYTQTTGMWVRAALAEDYGLPIERMTWVTQDPAHVAEYEDPAIVEHVPKTKSLIDLLKDGDVSACILGNDLPDDPDFVPVITDHRAVDAAWKTAHGFQPTNHVTVVTNAFAQAHPEAVRAAYRLLVEADAVARTNGTSSGKSLYGLEPVRRALQITLDTCNQQLLLPRSMTVDELLAPATALLGDLALIS
jgi:4,5-dihydroxyphthalate decarboxylase